MRLRSRLAATVLAPTAILAATLVAGSPAQAAQSESTVTTKANPVVDCGDSGSFWGWEIGTLANGTLNTVGCVSGGKITRVNVSYDKAHGSDVTVRFGWRFANVDGTASKGINWDKGAVTQKPGTTRQYSWYYPSGLTRPASHSCLQGVMQDQGTGTLFYTQTVCG